MLENLVPDKSHKTGAAIWNILRTPYKSLVTSAPKGQLAETSEINKTEHKWTNK